MKSGYSRYIRFLIKIRLLPVDKRSINLSYCQIVSLNRELCLRDGKLRFKLISLNTLIHMIIYPGTVLAFIAAMELTTDGGLDDLATGNFIQKIAWHLSYASQLKLLLPIILASKESSCKNISNFFGCFIIYITS